MVLYILAYLTIGAVIGWLMNLVAGDRGVKLLPSVFFGMGGALMGTAIPYFLDLAGSGYYATMGAFTLLFTVNVFRTKEKKVEGTEVPKV